MYDKIICPICGSNDVIVKDGFYICRACDTKMEAPKNYNDVDVKKLVAQLSAEEFLKLSPPKFEEAEERYDQLIKEYPKWSVAYWGKLRAKYGIKYELDVNDKSVPSCYMDSYVDITKDQLYNQCLLHAEDKNILEKYKSEAKRISLTFKEWSLKAKKIHYDIFLSFKMTDDKSRKTEDAYVMDELYSYLTSNGYQVFYAPVSMREFTGEPYYDAYIFNALEKSKVLIVYGSKPEYFTSTWVENEWMRYLGFIKSGKKSNKSLICVYKGFNPSNELPKKLASRQMYDGSSRTLFPDLLELIKKEIKTKKTSQKPIEKPVIVKNNNLEFSKNDYAESAFKNGADYFQRAYECFYHESKGDGQNLFKRAIPFFKRARRKGKKDCEYYIGYCYAHMWHYHKAKHWFKKGVKEGSIDSMFELGNVYYHLGSYEPDFDIFSYVLNFFEIFEAIVVFIHTCNMAAIYYLFRLECYYKEKGIIYIRKAAEMGNVKAINYLKENHID